MGHLGLSSDAYFLLGQRLIALQSRRLVLTLEGGYNTGTIGPLAFSLLSSLIGLPQAGETPEATAKGSGDPLSFGLMGPSAGRKEEARPSSRSLSDVLEDLKRHLGPHWSL